MELSLPHTLHLFNIFHEYDGDDVFENKIATVELIDNLDKKIHNQITQ